jgi:hypothetical protein
VEEGKLMADSAPWLDYQNAAQPQGGEATPWQDYGSSNAQPVSSEYVNHFQSLLDAGASQQQIEDYAKSQGVDPSQIGGLGEAIAYRDKGGKGAKVVIPQAQPTDAIAPLDQATEVQKPIQDDGAVGAAARGAADSITIGLAPRLFAVGDAINHATGGLTGHDTGLSGYDANLELERNRQANDESEHGTARLVGGLIGGLALPAGMEGVAFNAGKAALREGATMAEARAIAAVAARNRAATVGAGYGAGYGFNSSYGNASERLAGAGIGAATGAVGGLALGKAGELLAPSADAARVAARALPQSEGRQVLAAAQRQGVEPIAADVGGPLVRRLTSGITQTPLGVGPIVNASQRAATQAQSARDRIAAQIGSALRPEALGNNARQGALSYITSSGQAARGIYSAAEKAAGDTRIAPTQAIESLDRNIAELGETPGAAPGLETLKSLRDDLAKGDVSVAGIRNMRTVLRDQFIKDGLRGSDIERRVGQVIDSATQDVQEGLKSAGKDEAARLYAQADAAWKQRVNMIDQVIKPLIGTRDNPKSGEQIAKTLMADLQGNNARAVRFLNALPLEEQKNTQASIIGALGRVKAGAQDANGEGFSLPQFLTNWNDIGETAKKAYFGSETRAALNDLAKVAGGTKSAQKYANTSHSGGAIETNRILSAITAIPTLGTSLGAQYGLGRLLASPRFARWVARAPKTQLSEPAYLDRLTRIARAEPVIANDVLGLQRHLEQTLSSQPSLAANPQQQPDQGGNGNAQK